MSLKINRQSDLDELFSKFAIDPLESGKDSKKKDEKKEVSEQSETSK